MRALVLLLLAAATATAGAARAQDLDAQRRAVSELGLLNGQALACRYLDEVRRMKEAVVAHAPQERVFGADFDKATNDGFLRFRREGGTCPAPAVFAGRVDARIEALAASFAGEG
jgi:hypothetical protein